MGKGSLCPKFLASLAGPIPAWKLGMGECWGCMRGAEESAGVIDPGWVMVARSRVQERCHGHGMAWPGEPQFPDVPMQYWEALAFLLLSSPSFTSPCSESRREEGGRASP